jgi:hypothetical protein
MKRTHLLALALSLLALPALGDDKELKTARSNLKKNEKVVIAGDAGDDPKGVEQAVAAVKLVRAAENDEAVRFLLKCSHESLHEEVFQAIRSELGQFSTDDSVKTLALVLTNKDKKGDWRERVLVAQAALDVKNPKIVDGLVAALDDVDLNVLGPTIAAAGKKEEKRVVDALVKVLQRLEKVGGNEYFQARQALVDLTGQDFFTFDKWKEWWAANKDSFEFGKKGEAKEAKTQERVAGEKKPVFFGTEVRSSRLVFVIDVSGSMKMTDAPDNPDDPEIVKKLQDGEPNPDLARIARARKELKTAIENLQPWQRFNVLTFSDAFKTWQQDLTPATDANKKSALDFVANLKEGGGTYTDDAFKRAFDMKEIDTIFFLSDGAPQKKVTNPGKQTEDHQRELMKVCYEIVKKETRFRHVTIHSFGLCGLGVWYKKWGPRPPDLSLDPQSVVPLREFMQELAKMTGGEFKQL